MTVTIIGKARELIKEVGKEKAIEFFQKRIDDIGKHKNLQDLIDLSANETSIDFIKGKFDK